MVPVLQKSMNVIMLKTISHLNIPPHKIKLIAKDFPTNKAGGGEIQVNILEEI